MRKWVEEIKPHPRLRSDRLYRVRVVDISKNAESDAMEVTFELLEGNQSGRRLRSLLSLPIRPEGLTAEYFRSCHVEVNPQAKISPRDTVGCEIVARFEQVSDGASWQATHFEPVPQKEEGENNESIQL